MDYAEIIQKYTDYQLICEQAILNEEETTHIFELNFQGSNRVSGNGLGLTQSKMIVEAFGSTIYAKSSPENGMAIYIQLPVSKKNSLSENVDS